jgi:hypothetical protein
VKFIPPNLTNNFKNKYEPNPTTLAEVEKKLGASGKKLTANEIDPDFASILQQAQATGATTYLWTAGRDKLFLAFEGNIWAGCMLLKNR